MYVTANPKVQNLSWTNLRSYFTTAETGGMYHPFTLLSLALDHRLFGNDARGYHTVSLLLHALNTALVFLILRLLGSAPMAVAAGALFFGVHPLRVETVAWVSDRTDLLCAAFYLAALGAYLHHFRRNGGVRWLVLCLGLFLAALLSKPMAVTFPLVMFLCDRVVLGRKFRPRVLFEKTPFLLLSAIFAWVAYNGKHAAGGMRIGEPYSFLEGLLIPARGTVLYLSKSIFPVGLSALYPYPVKMQGQLPIEFLAAPIILALVVAAAWYGAKRTGKIVFGSLFFILTLIPVMQVVPLGHAYAADRYSYLPSVGLAYLLGEGMLYLHGSVRRKGTARLLEAVFVGAFLALSLLTWQRTGIWQDSFTLWNDVIAKFPHAALGYRNRGLAFLETGNSAGALNDLRRSLDLAPNDIASFINYSNALIASGRLEEAVKVCFQALAIAPNHEIHNNLGVALSRQGKSREAIQQYRRALALMPGYTSANVNLGVALAEMGRLTEAVDHYREALRSDPYHKEAIYNLAVDLEAMERFSEAAERYREFLRLAPGHPRATAGLSRVLTKLR